MDWQAASLQAQGKKIGLRTAHEVFADRTYQQDGTLTPRNQPHAMITDQKQALSQVVRMVAEGRVLSQQGIEVPISADTICIHGDGAHALEFARLIHQALGTAAISVRAFQG